MVPSRFPANTFVHPHGTPISIGRGTYGHDDSTFVCWGAYDSIEIGQFCSIAGGVRILSAGEHPTDLPSTYPFRTLTLLSDEDRIEERDTCGNGPVVIGNDVWLGWGATVLSGVTIGDGAVVGAGALVASDVAPYAVVSGNRAVEVRKRFDEATVERLLAVRWWDFADEQLTELEPFFYSDVQTFLTAAEAVRSAAAGVP